MSVSLKMVLCRKISTGIFVPQRELINNAFKIKAKIERGRCAEFELRLSVEAENNLDTASDSGHEVYQIFVQNNKRQV